MYLLSFLQCWNYTLVCDQIDNKSFVLLNASILGKYRKKPSLRSASQIRRQDSVTGGHEQSLGRGHKIYFESESVDKKQRSSSRNSTKSGVDQKKGLHLEICADFHEFWGEDEKKALHLKKCANFHEF